MDQKKIAPFYLVLTALFWCFNGVLTKYIPWSAFTCAVLRGAITFVCISLVRRCKVWKIKFNLYKVLCSVCYLLQGLLFFFALKYTTAANATVLQNTSPIYIMLFNAVLLKKYPKKQDVLACVALLLGVGITFAGSMEGGNALGNCMALISALFYAGVFFLSKMPQVDNAIEPVVMGNGYYVLMLPLCFLDGAFPNPEPGVWLAQLALGVFCGAGAWLCFSKGIQHTPALTANFITMIEPVGSAILTFLILNERPTALSLLGCGIVLVTLVFYNIWQAKSGSGETVEEKN